MKDIKTIKLALLSITTVVVAITGTAVYQELTKTAELNIMLNETSHSARLLSLGTPVKVKLTDNSEKPVILNDPSIEKNWGLMGTGGASDIRANSAWNITQGNKNVVVAVIDTGIDVNHSDLRENLWRNPGEIGVDSQGQNKAANGIDDDNNGFIDDVYGVDFVNNKGLNDIPSNKELTKDHHGHGTHVAGIIGAAGGNNIGISGV